MLSTRLFSIPARCISTSYGPLLQMRKNPFPEVHVTHEIHDIIKWVPPEQLKHWEPERTCDLKPFPKIDPNWLKLEFRPFAKIIDGLQEDHRQIFTVGHGNRRDAVNVIMENTLSKVRRHKFDTTSVEVTVAVFTIKIRNFQFALMQEGTTNKSTSFLRVALEDLVQKRRKYLNKLRLQDYKRFEWLIQVLSILYKPRPIHAQYIRRKDCFSTLVDMYCEDIVKKKMELYKAELEGEKYPFLQSKLETLKKIKEDEEGLRIPCSVDEEIAITVRQLEALKPCLDITPTPPKEITS